MDVSVLTAYKSELRRVATILKDKDHVKKRKRAEPEEEQPQKFYLVATFRWIDVADDTDEDEAPQQVEPAAPPAPPAPSPPATCAHLCSGLNQLQLQRGTLLHVSEKIFCTHST
eukprot:g66939.t1